MEWQKLVGNEGGIERGIIFILQGVHNEVTRGAIPTLADIIASLHSYITSRTNAYTHTNEPTSQIKKKHHIWSCADKTRQADGKFFKVSRVAFTMPSI